MTVTWRSWGGYPRTAQRVLYIDRREACLPQVDGSLLPVGNGRSYGDACLNDGGTVLCTNRLDRFIALDAESGTLRCESGVALGDILDVLVPKGWFLPVLPGTRHVTVGGAIANDIHGKNHHRVGSFGAHVSCLELLRSDGSRSQCSRSIQPERFRATVGGLGLTGLVTWAELRLQRIASPWLQTQTLRFRGLREFLELSAASTDTHAYTVAWLDVSSNVSRLARGLFFRANHAEADTEEGSSDPGHLREHFSVPFMPPFNLVSHPAVRVFNTLYDTIKGRSEAPERQHYQSFFFPLDALGHWYRIYGRHGFVQHQCVVPMDVAEPALDEILGRVRRTGEIPFLAVLKCFGDQPPEGLLSFPRRGVTLALDFPWRGERTLRLLDALADTVASAGGAIYPAKDARMSGENFRQYFPLWHDMLEHVDDRFSSSLWRRVMVGS